MATLEVIESYTGIYDLVTDNYYRGTYLPVNSTYSFNVVYRFKLTGPAVVTVKLVVKDKTGNVIKTLTVTEDWSYLQDETVYTYNSKNFGSHTLSDLGGDDLFLTWQFYLDGRLEQEIPDLVHIINASKIVKLGYLEIVEVGVLVQYEGYSWYTVEGKPMPGCIPGLAAIRATMTCRAVVNFKLDDPGDRGYRLKIKAGIPGFMHDLTTSRLQKGINVVSGVFYGDPRVDNFTIQLYYYYNEHNDNNIQIHSYQWTSYVTTGCDTYPSEPTTYSASFVVNSVTVTKTTLKVGESFGVSVTVANTGNAGGFVTVSIPLLAIDHTDYIDAGSIKKIDFGTNFAFTKEGTYNLCASANGSQKCVTLTVLSAEPNIQITDFFANTTSAKVGDTITITVELTNNGGSTGTATLKITVNGTDYKTDSVTLDPLHSAVKTYDIKMTTTGSTTICAEVV